MHFDFTVGNRSIGYKWFLGIMILAFNAVSACIIAREMAFSENVFDTWFVLFYGVPEYIKTDQSVFRLPILNMLFAFFGVFLVGGYPYEGMYGYGRNALVQLGDRRCWWLSKLIWGWLNMMVYFVCEVVFSILSSLILNNSSLRIEQSVMYSNVGSTMELLVLIMVAPWIALESLAMLQLLISVFMQPVFGYLAVVAILVVSAYESKPWMVGNAMFLARSEELCGATVSEKSSVLCCLIVIIACVTIGCLIIKRKDLLGKELGE